jgi:beta-ribofuranosylaminobenzene 5'-phosphate synthase
MNGTVVDNRSFKIIAFPRIHITLIGMNNDGYRINGGIGFSVSDPKIICSFLHSSEINIIDNRKKGFSSSEQKKIVSKLSKIYEEQCFTKKINCIISGNSFTHYGLGTSTATYLACIEALFIVNDREYEIDTIRKISERGGTSGIGINTYFHGGFVFDIGKRCSDLSSIHLPSSISGKKDKRKTQKLLQLKLPDWNIGLFIPNRINNLTEEEEIEFFKSTCPISKTDVFEILYESLYGVAGAIIEEDYETFCKAINAIQNTKWKQEERNNYGESLRSIENTLRSIKVDCLGMSSLGPGLFFFYNSLDKLYLPKNLNGEIIHSKLNNNGRIISYD